jgi:hypothetical protein
VSLVFTVLGSIVHANALAGNAILFDGIDDFIRIPNASQLSGMSTLTVEAWFCPLDTRSNPLIYKSDYGNIYSDRSYELYTSYGWAVFSGTSGWTWLYGDMSVVPDHWVHIAATYDSTQGVAKVFLNGTSIFETNYQADGVSPILESVRNSSQDVILGALLTAYGPSSFSYGIMDEVRLWDVARTNVEIKDWYNKPVNPTENGLIAYYNFDEGLSNQTVVDLTSFHNNGIIQGASRISSTAPIIPEPATLLLFGLSAVIARRKRR